MKKRNTQEFWYNVGLVLYYIILIIPFILLGFVFAGWFVGRTKRKHVANYIKRVEAKQARYKEMKMNMVDSLNKYEHKLERTSSEKKTNKYNRKIELLNKKINNINLILDDTSKQIEQPIEQKEQGKLMTKLDEKFGELKENIL